MSTSIAIFLFVTVISILMLDIFLYQSEEEVGYLIYMLKPKSEKDRQTDC